MLNGLPNLQLMSDAHSLNIFATAISQAAVQLVNASDKTSPEYAKMFTYYKENFPKLKLIIEHLEADLG